MFKRTQKSVSCRFVLLSVLQYAAYLLCLCSEYSTTAEFPKFAIPLFRMTTMLLLEGRSTTISTGSYYDRLLLVLYQIMGNSV